MAGYDDTSYRIRLVALVRGFVGVAGYDREARGMVARACIEAARTRDDLADIVNAGIEELLRCRRELPAFGTLLKLARSARALVNRAYHRRIAASTAASKPATAWLPCCWCRRGQPGPAGTRSRRTRRGPARNGCASTWPTSPGCGDRPWQMRCSPASRTASSGTSPPRPAPVSAAVLSHVTASKRVALMATLLRSQVARALDDAAEMFVRLTTRMHNRAREALDEHRARQAAETDALVALLRQTVLACQDQEAKPDVRLSAVEDLLLPDADAILAKCEAHAAFAGNNYLPLLARFYGVQRASFLRFLAHAAPVSTSQDRATEQAIGFLMAHRTDRRAKLQTAVGTKGADGDSVQGLLDLSWVSEKWWPLLTGRTAREPAPTEVDRRYFEICLFTQVVNELKSGDLCIPGSEDYGDYRNQLVSWEEYKRDVEGYAEQAGIPADPGAFVAVLKARFAKTADAINQAFPKNEHVEIVAGEPVVKRLRARDGDDGTAFLERLLKARMVPAGVLEALADTEHWLGWTRHFGPVSGFEAKLDRPRERDLATVFCYGSGLGPSQAARSLKGLDRRHVAFANQRHITEETLDDAITGVIDAYARVGLHRHWGSGDTASADGMKWDVHPESLRVVLPHPLRRLWRHRLLPGLGHLHRPVLALPGLRCLRGPRHPRLRGREPVAAAALHGPLGQPRPERPDLRAGVSARYRADAAHPQLAGPAPVPA